jgi:F-box interacting protein
MTPTVTQLEYPLNNRDESDTIVGSCQGILCIQRDLNFPVLWNPSIRKFTKLPSFEFPPNKFINPTYAFGYDHSTDTYKVVAVFSTSNIENGVYQLKTLVNVHTMGTNYWKRIQTEFPFKIPFTATGKFVSGCFNCVGFTDSVSPAVIVSLDLEKESYRALLLPDFGGIYVALTLEVLMDGLCMLCHSGTFSDVWVMKEFGNENSWARLFRVPYMGGVDSGPYTKAFYVYEDDQVLLECQSKLVIYNSRDGTFKSLEIQSTDGWMVPQVYQQSLISPCSY